MSLEILNTKIVELSRIYNSLNSKYWNRKKKSNNKYVLIEGYNDTNIHMMLSSTIANAINEIHNYIPIVLMNKKQKTKEHMNIYNSFSITKICFFNKKKIKITYILKSIFDLINIFSFYYKKDKFLKFEKNGILLGDLIYDEYIRHNNNYRNFSILSLNFTKHFLKSMIKYYFTTNLFKQYDIKYVILSHRVYNIAILHRLALANNAKSVISRITSIRIYDNITEMMTNEYKPSIETLNSIVKKKLSSHIDLYLKKRFNGEIHQHDVRNAYVNKQGYTKSQLCEALNIHNNYPIVFIMPHAFSDANHSNEFILFDDYYSWFIETLNKIENIENINWIVKPHPSSMMYNEVGEVKALLKSYSKHIKIVPDDLSTNSIFNIAKTVITISGTIGIEAACMGIKPIIAGDATYRGFGVAIEPNTKNEYFNILENIQNYNYSTNITEQETAKAIIYWLHDASFIKSNLYENEGFLPGNTDEKNLKQKIYFYEKSIDALKDKNPKEDNFYKSVKKMILNNKKYPEIDE